MKEFEYVRASDVSDAVQKAGGSQSVKFLGGGTNLVDLMRYGVESPDRLVDISHLNLTRITDLGGGGLRIGALVRNSDLAADKRVEKNFPMLSQALLNGASPQLRNMATTGGNLLQRTRCYYFYDVAMPCNKRSPGSGCPAINGQNRIHAILGQSDQCIAVHPSDMAVAMRALDAVINVEGPQGKRSVPIADFHRLPEDHPEKDTNLQPGELIVSVDIPSTSACPSSSYLKIRDRASYAFSLVSVAAGVNMANGKISEARIALGGVAHKPWRVMEAEKALAGQIPSRQAFASAAETIIAGAKGYSHNEFKIELAKRSIVRILSDLTGVSA